MTSETISRLTCLRCDYRWFPRKEGLPVRCPHCKSPYWNRTRANATGDGMEAKVRAMQAGRDYYYAHEAEIVGAHRGKFVAVTGDGVLDVDEDESTLLDRVWADGAFSLFVHRAGDPQRIYRIGPQRMTRLSG